MDVLFPWNAEHTSDAFAFQALDDELRGTPSSVDHGTKRNPRLLIQVLAAGAALTTAATSSAERCVTFERPAQLGRSWAKAPRGQQNRWRSLSTSPSRVQKCERDGAEAPSLSRPIARAYGSTAVLP